MIVPTVLIVMGTRPQYIKYAALSPFFDNRFRSILIDTGQHYSASLSQYFIEEYNIPPPSQILSAEPLDGLPRLSVFLDRLDDVIEEQRPDAVLCFGDTDSALAAALAGVKRSVPVIHVEAGERSRYADGRRVHPASIPEESNRVYIDHNAALLLCATEAGQSQCHNEGCRGTIVMTGDIMYDLYLRSDADRGENVLSQYGLTKEGYYFATIHREINTNNPDRFSELLETLNGLDLPVVLPLHPRSTQRIQYYKLTPSAGALKFIEPLTHADTLALTRNARRVLTDSGGLTRESYFCAVPSLCLDDSTAWFTIVEAGWCTITGTDSTAIHTALPRQQPTEHPLLFGDGNAAQNTINAIHEFLAGC